MSTQEIRERPPIGNEEPVHLRPNSGELGDHLPARVEHVPNRAVGEEVRPHQLRPANTSKEKTRLQIDLDPAQLARVDQLVQVCGFGTKKEMFDYGVTILEWAAKHARTGRVIGAIDPENDSYIELEMPPLANARQSAKPIEVDGRTTWRR